MASVGYTEARAALAAARRQRRLSATGLGFAKAELLRLWNDVDVQQLDDQLVHLAGETAESFSLRALDAVHLAAALALDDPDLVVATWDEHLRSAAISAGLAVAP